ncbi:hypothetical protein LWI29_010301 [Acer saccharum]|uniref:PGG domain-containing protein n=1 Tax=Acer saccharum TaxID=4024 RepID=A0AA39RTQ5_ACESA|nr:hypothetical protein LWI29_010301 [Acer saccharum]
MEDSKTKKFYRNVLDNDWNALKEEALSFQNDAELLRPISVHGDSIVHLVVHSGTEEPLKQILNRLDGYTMSVNKYGNTVLHEAAISGNLKAVKLLVEKNEELLVKENDSEETPLFKAAAFGNTKIVNFLASCEGQTVDGTKQLEDIHRKNKNGETVLFAAVQGQHFGTALELLKIDEKLTELEDGNQTSLNMLAQIPSAFKTQYKMSIWKKLLYFLFPLAKKIWKEKRDHGLARELARKLIKKDKYSWEQNLMRFVFNTAMVEEPTTKQLFAAIRSRNVEAVTWELDKHPQQLEELNRKILNLTTEEEERQGNPVFAAIITGNVELVKFQLNKYPQQLDQLNLRIQKKLDEDANPLFAAIRAGNVKVVKLILEEYPQALEQINIMNQNILHVAAMYRQKEIFNLVKTNKIPMIRLARQIDIDGYTILHSVADTQHYKGGTRSGPAYKLQEELKWFDSVKEIMPSSYIMLRAKNNMTASEILKEKHEEQLKKAQSWIKGTSQSCSAVAVLVATVVFAAAFTVPGGTNDNNGFPILLHSPFFMSFTALDVLSLSCSLTSVVMFLSILTSPFELEDFRASLPRKLTLGFFLLFLSVAATMLTFTSTIVLIIRLDRDRKFPMILLCSAAFFPVFVLALTHFPLIFSFIKDWVSSVNQKIPRRLRFF